MAKKTTRKLDDEWSDDYAHTEQGIAALARWQRTEPDLAGLVDLDDVLETRTDPDRAYDILAALARHAPCDPIAARTLLQALLPGLVALALKTFKHDRRAFEDIVALAWLRIRCYPTTRSGSVAGNVVLDVRKDYIAERRAAAPVEEILTPEPFDGVGAPPAEEVAMKTTIVDDLANALADGVVTERALDVLVRTRTGVATLEEVAADYDTTSRYAQCIRWRAEKKLRQHLDRAA